MIVEPEHIQSAGQQLAERGTSTLMQELGEAEPALASYIGHTLNAMAGKLALAGAPTPVVQGVHEDALDVVLVALQAFRLGQYQLWKDALPGTPLGRLEEQPPADAPKPPRKKRRGGQAGQA
jgi:hypothetical protein